MNMFVKFFSGFFIDWEETTLKPPATEAIRITWMMAESLTRSSLMLYSAKIHTQKTHECDDRIAGRKVKTDCIFLDREQNEYVAVAWVNIHRAGEKMEKWSPDCRNNFIKMGDENPCQMEFVGSKRSLSLVQSHDDGLETIPPALKLDYSRIR